MFFGDQRICYFFASDFLEKPLKNKSILFVDVLADSLSCKERFSMFPGHADEALYLVFMFFPNVLVDLHFELQAFGEVDPVHTLAPSLSKPAAFEHLVKLIFSSIDVLVGGVNDEVVILGEDRDEAGFFYLGSPRQLLNEVKELGLIDSVSLSQACHIDDAV